jgi:hypothetical protein
VSKPPSPLLGFNNNVRHKGRVFHIQTEDSGVRHPHIITHLFMDGGRILKSTKTSYAEHLGTDGYADRVRGMMKEQHKAMFVALRDGTFDAIIDGGPVSKKEPAPSAAAASVEVPAAPPPPVVLPVPVAPAPEEPRTFVAAARAPSEPPPRRPSPFPSPPMMDSSSRPTETMPAQGTLDINVAALDRAARAAAEEPGDRISSPGINLNDLPPPPPNVLRTQLPAREGGYTQVATPEGRARSKPPSSPAMRRSSERPAKKSVRPPAVVPGRPGSGRYAVARPSSAGVSRPPTPLAGASRPPEGRSIFGEDLISEKSLDEVILSYLAEDLEATPKK